MMVRFPAFLLFGLVLLIIGIGIESIWLLMLGSFGMGLGVKEWDDDGKKGAKT